jgi:hypothetical protein
VCSSDLEESMKLIMFLITFILLSNEVISQTKIVTNSAPKYPSNRSNFISNRFFGGMSFLDSSY